MKLSYYAAVVFVENIEKSKEFYQKLLRMEIEHDFGKNVTFKGGFAIWELRAEHIVPVNLKERMLKHGNRFELYLETTDIESTFSELKKAEVEFLHEIHEEPWGQMTIRLFDPDNHLIEIGETLQTFVLRMKNEGMDIDQISEKTHIPKETVVKLLE